MKKFVAGTLLSCIIVSAIVYYMYKNPMERIF